MGAEIRYELSAHGTSYTLTKGAPRGEAGSVYRTGGRLDADLSAGMPYESALLEDIYARRFAGAAVDVGAHVGNHTLWLAVVCGLAVHAFEPDHAAYRWLRRNVRDNDLDNRVTTYRVALGVRDGQAAWDTDVRGLAHPDADGSLPMRKLDGYRLDDVAVVKIDVESAEPSVLSGATETLLRCRPVVYAEAKSRAARGRISSVLAPLGYLLTDVVPVSSPVGVWAPA